MTQSTEATTPQPNAAQPDPGGGQAQQPPEARADAAPSGGDLLDMSTQSTSASDAAGDVLAGADGTGQEGVPETYTFEPPEGLEVNQEALEAAMAMAKEVGLTQKQFDAIAKFDLERSEAANKVAVDEWQGRVEGWRTAARNDREFGGQNYEANIKTALRVVEKFGDADLKALIQSPSPENPEGLAIGNHPAFLRLLNRIGKAMSDPDFVQSEGVVKDGTDEARLRRIYPSMFNKSA